MITATQLKLFEIFAKMPFAQITRKEIKLYSKQKSNNALALTINLLKQEEVIIEEKIGKSGLLSLNLENDLTYHYIALCNHTRLAHLAMLSLKHLTHEISQYTHFYAIVVFGSYSIGEQKKDSDLDVAVFIEQESQRKEIKAIANSAQLKSILEMDVHIITKNEMIEMLTNKDENLGKQIARKHMAIYNQRIFYDIILEGMEHGFRI